MKTMMSTKIVACGDSIFVSCPNSTGVVLNLWHHLSFSVTTATEHEQNKFLAFLEVYVTFLLDTTPGVYKMSTTTKCLDQ